MVLASAQVVGFPWGAFMPLLIVASLWELVWKGFALWYSAKAKQKAWFVCILIFNTIGILPIIYLLIHKPWKKKSKKAKK